MKKWMRCLLLISVLLIAAFPVFTASAKDSGTAELTPVEDGNNVTVALNLTEGITEAITSLRFQIFVSVDHGSMTTPSFEFDSRIVENVAVCDTDITWDSDAGDYIIDIILSGQTDIFVLDGDKDGSVVIGTVVLPSGEEYYAEVGLAVTDETGGEEDAFPTLQYVDMVGAQTMSVHMTNSLSVFVGQKPEPETEPKETEPEETEPEETEPQETESEETGPETKPQQPETTPQQPETTPQQSETTPPVSETEPTSSSDKTKKIRAKATTRVKNKRIYFTWNRVAGVDGYRIYQYNSAKKKYELLATIKDGKKTTYKTKKNYKYATSFKFKIRAFAYDADGKKVLGASSNVIKVMTRPAQVTNVSATSDTASQVKITWKKVARAKGYRIFRSRTGDSDDFACIGTVKGGNVLQYVDKRAKSGAKYYYRVRAYTVDSEGKRLVGKNSAIKSVKVK